MHVVSVCFRCFIHMFQVFHLDVAKVDMNIAYVFYNSFQVFSDVLDVCCKCFSYFRRILQVFLSGCRKSRSEMPRLLGCRRGSLCGACTGVQATGTHMGFLCASKIVIRRNRSGA
jgi:hypothetical protein